MIDGSHPRVLKVLVALVVIASITTGALAYAAYRTVYAFRTAGETVRRIRFDLVSVERDPLDSTVTTVLSVRNTGEVAVTAEELRFSIYANDEFVATILATDLREEIPPSDPRVLQFRAALTPYFSDILEAELRRPGGTWSLRGTAVVRLEGAPMRFPMPLSLRGGMME